MKARKTRITGIFAIIASCLIIVVSMISQVLTLLFIGIFLLVVSMFLAILLPSLYVFRQDRTLDKDTLQKKGLHIVICCECNRENVYEDKFCVYCGEELVLDNE